MPTLRRTVFNPEGELVADGLDQLQEQQASRAQQDRQFNASMASRDRALNTLTGQPGISRAPTGGGGAGIQPAPIPAPVTPEVDPQKEAIQKRLNELMGLDNPQDPLAIEAFRANQAADLNDKFAPNKRVWRASGSAGTVSGLNPGAERAGYTLPPGAGDLRPAGAPIVEAIAPQPGAQMPSRFVAPKAPERGPMDAARMNEIRMLQQMQRGEVVDPFRTPDETPDDIFIRETKQRAILRQEKAKEAAALKLIEDGKVEEGFRLMGMDNPPPELVQAYQPSPVEREAKSDVAADTARSGFTFQEGIKNIKFLAKDVRNGRAGVDEVGNAAEQLAAKLVERGISPEQARAMIGDLLDQDLPGLGRDIANGISAVVAQPIAGLMGRGDAFGNVGNSSAIRADLKQRGFLR